ncbi:MAG TPA: hypothetical protein VHK86_06975 [Nitrososphaera sp.]|nr:hypothetical protein [Nitrososphaera sp.]
MADPSNAHIEKDRALYMARGQHQTAQISALSKIWLGTAVGVLLLVLALLPARTHAVLQSQSGPVGVEGVIPSNPPTQAATITVPGNGQTFNNIPITVSGLCPKGLLVEIFKNGVFSGSTECTNGSFSIQIDLFNGQNDLIARVYDSLNQAGPDSNKVTVFFNGGLAGTGPKPTITSNFAKRGADPGSVLTWPITISGGVAPYAISIDWGDKSPNDLISRATAGDFNLEHTYSQAGVYNITIKASDANGAAAFLQVVGIANGPIQQSAATGQSNSTTKTIKIYVWWPLLPLFVLTIAAFWLGKQHQLQVIRDRLKKGQRPI